MRDPSIEKSVKGALESVAKREGISVEEVRREIELAVAAARENGDSNIKAFWDGIPAKGGELTAEEVIGYFLRMHIGEN
jgi:hypothetical protein